MPPLAGSFLVARPVLNDPNFSQTVVLLLKHGAEGAFGLVVNRPAGDQDLPFPVFTGGPCPAPGLIMLHGHRDWLDTPDGDEPQGEVAPGVFLGDAECVGRVAEDESGEGPRRFRMFAGYSGWGPDQLERELASGAWFIAQASAELLFDTPPEQLWDRLSPPAVPRPSMN